MERGSEGFIMKKYFRFTKQFVTEITTEKTRERFYDSVADGLVLSVTKAGSKSYYCKFWRSDIRGARGAHIERIIGQAHDLTVDQARTLLRELKSEFVVYDPRLEKNKRVWCLQDFHDKWKSDIDHEVRVGNATERYARIKNDMWLQHIPPELVNRRIEDVGKQEMITLLMDLKERSKSVHNKLAKHFKGLYKIARDRLELDIRNPLGGYTVPSDNIKETFLSVEQMPVFMAAVKTEKQIYQDLILCLLLTAQRKEAVRSMQWSHLDLTAMTWNIPKEHMKGSVSGYVVPLHDALVDILERRKSNSKEGEQFVFPSHCSKCGYITGEHFWDRIRDSSGITKLCLHDLRRTMGSWLAVSGVDIYKISKVLAHKDVRVTQKVYAHLQAVDARGELNRVGGLMLNSETKKAAVDIESIAANLSGEDKMKLISVLSRSVF
tara:strand:+ start:765 stop:2072 length:1308 start_codon:yes stop_codon:yes gene_type:complete